MDNATNIAAQLTELSYAVDTFYLLVTGALVMWMAAGFAMLEAGLVRAKNTAEILTKNIGLYAIGSIMYMLFGYSIMYPDAYAGGVFQSLSSVGTGLISNTDHTTAEVLASGGETYYSAMADFFFQVVFVTTAMSIVSGAVAERMKLWAFFVFALFLTGFIYPVQGFWKWGGGWLNELGFLDFAGSGAVHLCGASAALAGVLLLGARKGKYGSNGQIFAIPGCNLPMATLGMLILWLGWFGFNGGSQLRLSSISDANAVALIFVNTNMAAAGGLVFALVIARLWFGKADLTMALNGALAGLVAITAEPLTPTPLLATTIGAIGGGLVIASIITLDKLRIDDPVGAISVHGAAGMWGLVIASIVTLDKLRIDDPVGAISVHGAAGMWGLLAVPWSNTEATVLKQLTGLAAIFAWVFFASLAVWLVIRLTLGIRVAEQHEYVGVDRSECGLEAYPEFTRD